MTNYDPLDLRGQEKAKADRELRERPAPKNVVSESKRPASPPRQP